MPRYSFRVVNHSDRVLRNLDRVTQRTLTEIGNAAVQHVRERVPVDTGALRDSYMSDVDVNHRYVRVGSPLNYAPYVELGTGPNYETPPDWVTNHAQRGHHAVDPWWYLGDDGEWHQGWFVHARPHLRPAFTEHIREYIDIFRRNLENG